MNGERGQTSNLISNQEVVKSRGGQIKRWSHHVYHIMGVGVWVLLWPEDEDASLHSGMELYSSSLLHSEFTRVLYHYRYMHITI